MQQNKQKMTCFSILYSDSLNKEISGYGETLVSHQVSNKQLYQDTQLCEQNSDLAGVGVKQVCIRR